MVCAFLFCFVLPDLKWKPTFHLHIWVRTASSWTVISSMFSFWSVGSAEAFILEKNFTQVSSYDTFKVLLRATAALLLSSSMGCTSAIPHLLHSKGSGALWMAQIFLLTVMWKALQISAGLYADRSSQHVGYNFCFSLYNIFRTVLNTWYPLLSVTYLNTPCRTYTFFTIRVFHLFTLDGHLW